MGSDDKGAEYRTALRDNEEGKPMKALRQPAFVLVGALAGMILPILPFGILGEVLGPSATLVPSPYTVIFWLQVIWAAMPFIGGALGAHVARKTARQ